MILCQSCGDLITVQELQGTNADGTVSTDYCLYCYQKGVFTQDLSMSDMIEQNLTRIEGRENEFQVEVFQQELRQQLEVSLPLLKRWQ